MVKHEPRSPDHLFIETKLGIITRSGNWYHITSDEIEEYAPGLLDKRSLDELVEAAEAWVHSADGLSMLAIMILLLLINPWIAFLAVIAFHGLWYLSKSAFVNRQMVWLLELLNSAGFMFVLALFILSALGIAGNYLGVGLGLVAFFLFKLGLLRKFWDILHRQFTGQPISLSDRVFKMVIIRYGLYEDTPPRDAEEMEERFKDLALRRRGSD
ncbi:MAG: hypothetical protein R3211_10470 [Balneolaceae bacterium]|nr:hypothetical protein [Balneolaceae bacterium]